MSRNIEAFCPKIDTWVEVRDNWYPSYKKYNKLWVEAFLQVVENYCGNKYGIQLMFWGADDTALEKWIVTDNFDEAVKSYRKLKNFLNKIKKINTLNLKDFLYKYDFEPW